MPPGPLHSLLAPLRRKLAHFAVDPADRFVQYTGQHGCLRVAASHIAWNQVEGDYLEFGVFRGDSFAEAWHALMWHRDTQYRASPDIHNEPNYERWRARPPKMFAFDSFAGLPGGEAARHTDYHEGAFACTEEQFTANVLAAGVPRSQIVTVKGFYDQTLTPATRARIGLERAALVMIDCDLYESTVPVLDFLTGVIGQGTILIFHDWYRYNGSRLKGEQRACREWLERTPRFELEPWWQEGPQAKAFLVHDNG